jgi:hypothetical protein
MQQKQSKVSACPDNRKLTLQLFLLEQYSTPLFYLIKFVRHYFALQSRKVCQHKICIGLHSKVPSLNPGSRLEIAADVEVVIARAESGPTCGMLEFHG